MKRAHSASGWSSPLLRGRCESAHSQGAVRSRVSQPTSDRASLRALRVRTARQPPQSGPDRIEAGGTRGPNGRSLRQAAQPRRSTLPDFDPEREPRRLGGPRPGLTSEACQTRRHVTSARPLASASLTTPNRSGCETSRARKTNQTRRANRAPAPRSRSFAPNFTPRHLRTSAALGLGD